MTVLGTTTRQTFDVIGGTNYDLSPSFLFFDAQDLVVVHVLDDGTEVILVYGTDYDVLGGNGGSGSVITVNVLVGGNLVVYRDVEAVQQYDARVGDGFNTDTFERQLDRMVMAIQEIDDEMDRSIHVSPGAPGDVNLQIPAQPNKYFRWNDDATQLILTDGTVDFSGAAAIESATLIDGQTLVPFVNDVGTAAFVLNGPDCDNGRLLEGTDFTVNPATNSVELKQSYPAGSILTMTYVDLTTYQQLYVLNIATLADLRKISNNNPIYLAEEGRAGHFKWNGGNLSSEVAADTQSGIYVAPDVDPTGASGAWVRQYDGGLNIEWFGAVSGTDSTTAIQAAVTFASVNNGGVVEFPIGQYTVTRTITVDAIPPGGTDAYSAANIIICGLGGGFPVGERIMSAGSQIIYAPTSYTDDCRLGAFVFNTGFGCRIENINVRLDGGCNEADALITFRGVAGQSSSIQNSIASVGVSTAIGGVIHKAGVWLYSALATEVSNLRSARLDIAIWLGHYDTALIAGGFAGPVEIHSCSFTGDIMLHRCNDISIHSCEFQHHETSVGGTDRSVLIRCEPSINAETYVRTVSIKHNNIYGRWQPSVGTIVPIDVDDTFLYLEDHTSNYLYNLEVSNNSISFYKNVVSVGSGVHKLVFHNNSLSMSRRSQDQANAGWVAVGVIVRDTHVDGVSVEHNHTHASYVYSIGHGSNTLIGEISKVEEILASTVPLSADGTFDSVFLTPSKMYEKGVYRLSYSVTIDSKVSTVYTIRAKLNGTVIPNSVFTGFCQSDLNITLHSDCLFTLSLAELAQIELEVRQPPGGPASTVVINNSFNISTHLTVIGAL